MGWYLAPALGVLRSEVDTRWPDRDKTSDGTIGDPRHQASRSDHNPNSRGSVNAWDMDKDGVDPWAVIAAFQQHPSAHYWIYQRQIADRDNGWRRRPYHGSNPHDKHVHFSIGQTATAENDRRPWGLHEEDALAALSDNEQHELLTLARRINQVLETGQRPEGNQTSGGVPINWLVRTLAEIQAELQQTRPGLDRAELSALVDPLTARITAALQPGGITTAQVRAALVSVLRGDVDRTG